MRAGRLSIVNKSDPMAPTHYILSAAVLPQPAAAISSRRLQLPPRRARPRMAILAGAPVCRRKIQNQLKSFLKEHFHLRRPPKFDKILYFLKIFPNKHQRKGKLSIFWGLFRTLLKIFLMIAKHIWNISKKMNKKCFSRKDSALIK